MDSYYLNYILLHKRSTRFEPLTTCMQSHRYFLSCVVISVCRCVYVYVRGIDNDKQMNTNRTREAQNMLQPVKRLTHNGRQSKLVTE